MTAYARRELEISIHAPRTGSDKSRKEYYISPHDFNPRSPHGERPCMTSLTILITSFQSTLPARGATRTRRRNGETRGISIHAPRTGSDGAGLPNQPGHDISIHAPRTGSDDRQPLLRLDGRHFNPRSPHGERRSTTSVMLLTLRFQSTLPARGATIHAGSSWAYAGDFNPRSPHGERPHVLRAHDSKNNFNPRSPHGERRLLACY